MQYQFVLLHDQTQQERAANSMDVLTVLKQKTHPVYTVAINQSVDDAINLMVAKKVGALIVTDKERPVGLFAERDVFRYYLLDSKCKFSDIQIKNAMTDRLISVESTDAITDSITLMIKSGLEHLAVMEDNNIIGLLELKDLVEFQLESLTDEIHQLKDYIDDLHEAGQD
jgi:CBS domain-containing protein